MRPKVSPNDQRSVGKGPIVLTPGDAQELRRLLNILGAGAETDRSHVTPFLRSRPAPPADILIRARAFEAKRRRRVDHFPKSMFGGELAWDLLMVLYTAHGRSRLNVSSLTLQAGGTQTTTLRWLAYLKDCGLVTIREHPTDKRIQVVEISEDGVSRMEAFFSE